jgi:HSP20 family molecular chaperone IbpA
MFYAPAIRSGGLMPEPSLLDSGFERFMSDALGSFGQMGHDLQEDEQSWTMTLDVPGIPRENLSVQIEGETLRIESTGGTARKFKGAYDLPGEVDVEGSSAKLENGVLTLKLAKAKSAQSRQITIQ